MTDRTPSAPSHPAAPTPEDRPGFLEYPKALYKPAEPHAPTPAPQMVSVDSKAAEDEAKKQGYVDGPAFEAAQAKAK